MSPDSPLSIANRQRLDALVATNWSAVDTTTHTINGGGGNMAALLTIPGGDLKAGTCYRITTYGDVWSGTVSNTAAWRLNLNGDHASYTMLDMTPGYLPANHGLEWKAVLHFVCKTPGSSSVCRCNMLVVMSHTDGGTQPDAWTCTFTVSPNTNNDITIAPWFQWVTGTGGPTTNGYDTLFERLGP